MKSLAVVVLTVAWTLSGCGAATLPQLVVALPEAARQFKAAKQRFWSPEPAAPNDQRFAAAGSAALHEGNYSLAETYLDAALASNPDNPCALLDLGAVLENTNRPRKARAVYAKVDVLTARATARTATCAHQRRVAGIGGGAVTRPGVGTTRGVAAAAETDSRSDQAERAVLNRFATLARLRDVGLISSAEYRLRRAASLGALLPKTGGPPSPALARPAPRTRDLIERMRSIMAFHTAGALTDAEYAAERAAIIESLMPLKRDGAARALAARTRPSAPELERLDDLLAANLISTEEHQREIMAGLGQFEPAAGAVAPMDVPQEVEVEGTDGGDQAPATKTAAQEFGVHLASFRTPERARRNWGELRGTHGDILDGLGSRIARVDMGEKIGVFFRLVAGPVADETKARALCEKFKRRLLYCAPMVF